MGEMFLGSIFMQESFAVNAFQRKLRSVSLVGTQNIVHF